MTSTINGELLPFFLICLPGLEELVVQELEDILPEVTSEIQNGGVLCWCHLEEGFGLNARLSLATRILLRLGSFKARDVVKLYKKLRQLPLQNYFSHESITIKSSSAESRLFDSRKIEKAASDAVRDCITAQEPGKNQKERASKLPAPTLYLRIENDMVTVSVDTSGERLDRRSPLKDIAHANMRETLARALAWKVHTLHPEVKLLWDPFCGSGTILQEALGSSRPGRFAWQGFYKSIVTEPQTTTTPPSLFDRVAGSDLSEVAQEAASRILQDKGNIVLADFFQITSAPEEGSVMLSNLPYGKRVKLPFPDFFSKVRKHCQKIEGIDAAYVLVPLGTYSDLMPVLKTTNGGISVGLYRLR